MASNEQPPQLSEILDVESRPPAGYLTRSDNGEAVALERTAENEHFFIYNHEHGRSELIYQGSGAVVDLLALYLLDEELYGSANADCLPYERHLAFFDREGTFYNFATLRDLRINSCRDGAAVQKHTALFDVRDGTSDTYQPLAIAVDDIYCVSGVAHPVIWEGDGNN